MRHREINAASNFKRCIGFSIAKERNEVRYCSSYPSKGSEVRINLGEMANVIVLYSWRHAFFVS